jgi:RNA 2',3'-cyclic 3'-phosphodiesterase
VKEAATVAGDERLRLFLALELGSDVTTALGSWADRRLVGPGVRRVDAFHVTLAFLGTRPASELPAIVGALRESAADCAPFTLAPNRYRETRAVGMLVLDDPSGEATRLAERLQGRLEALGVYERERRPWLPHITVVRFRERPRLDPPLPDLAPFAPSGAAAFLSRLRRTGARYEALESLPLGR